MHSEEFPFASRSMGIGVFPITTDGFVPLIRRSAWTAEAANKIDRVGGHPEPDQAVSRAKGHKAEAFNQETLGQMRENLTSSQARRRGSILNLAGFLKRNSQWCGVAYHKRSS